MKNKIILLLIMLMGLYSCGKQTVFEKYEKFENNTWNKSKILSFDVPIDNINKSYDVYVVVKNTDNYTYNNLYIGVYINTPAGDTRFKDYYIDLRNEDRSFTGKLINSLWETKVKIMEKATFTKAGIHKFEIYNFMQYVSLSDINEIGLVVEKIN